MLLLLLCLPSVAYSASAYFRVFPCNSVFVRGKCLFLIPSLTHPALKDMLLLFSLNLTLIEAYDNAHDELAYLALRIFSQNW